MLTSRTAEQATDTPTRRRVLRLVVEAGPVSVVELARELDLTAAGVRRHVAALEEAGHVAVFAARPDPGRRGRPARRWVATSAGQAALSSAYADLATMLLRHIGEVAGPDGVRAFAERRAAELAGRHRLAVAGAGPDVAARVEALAAGLAEDGYASSTRPAPGGRAVQLCQGHCPVLAVATRFPELCEAETRMFSDLLGVHVQRLSTLAAGGHVCTTHVPLAAPRSAAAVAAVPGPDVRTGTSDRPDPGAMEGTR